MFDESASWYLPPTPDLNSNLTMRSARPRCLRMSMKSDPREESLISFWLSGPNGRLSRFDQAEEELASSGDSAVHSLRGKPRRRLTRKEKGKNKVSDSGTERNE